MGMSTPSLLGCWGAVRSCIELSLWYKCLCRNLLTTHDIDPRYCEPECRARVANLYLPLIGSPDIVLLWNVSSYFSNIAWLTLHNCCCRCDFGLRWVVTRSNRVDWKPRCDDTDNWSDHSTADCWQRHVWHCGEHAERRSRTPTRKIQSLTGEIDLICSKLGIITIGQ